MCTALYVHIERDSALEERTIEIDKGQEANRGTEKRNDLLKVPEQQISSGAWKEPRCPGSSPRALSINTHYLPQRVILCVAFSALLPPTTGTFSAYSARDSCSTACFKGSLNSFPPSSQGVVCGSA